MGEKLGEGIRKKQDIKIEGKLAIGKKSFKNLIVRICDKKLD